jgi:hypothetical protein
LVALSNPTLFETRQGKILSGLRLARNPAVDPPIRLSKTTNIQPQSAREAAMEAL